MKSEEARCDAVVTAIYGKDAVVKFGRRGQRTTGSVGVSDRMYFVGNDLLFYEVKEGKDRLSDAQRSFLERVQAADHFAGCGDADTLLAMLQSAKVYWPALCVQQIAKWSRPTK